MLSAAGAATLGGALSALSAGDAAAARLVPDSPGESEAFEGERERERATSTFPQSVASGGPTPSGVLLWTRVAPDAYDGETSENNRDTLLSLTEEAVRRKLFAAMGVDGSTESTNGS